MQRSTLGLTFIFSLAFAGCQKADGDASPTHSDAGDSRPAPSDQTSPDDLSVETRSGDTRSGNGSATAPGEPSDDSSHGSIASHRDGGASNGPISGDAGDTVPSLTQDAPDASEAMSGPGLTSTDGTPSQPDRTEGSSDAPDAPLLFAAHCESCHAKEGRGKPGEAPEIQHPVVDHAAWVVRHGRSHDSYATEMPAFDEHLVSNEHLNLILVYLGSFEVATTGKGLFLDYCANCHGADAGGGTTGQRLPGEAAQLLVAVRQGHDRENLGSRSTYMPRWSTEELSDEQVAAIADYVATVSE